MRLKITDPAAFTDAVAWVAKHINPKVHIPILATIRVEATVDGTRLSVFDWETSATVYPVPGVEVVEAGVAAVGGAMLAQLCAAVRPERVEADDSGLRLSSRRSTARLPVMPLAELPELPEPPEPTVTMPGLDLARSINQLAPLTGDPIIMPVLGGINFASTKGVLTLAATDRYRLAQHQHQVDGTLAVDVTVPVSPLLATVKGWGDGPARLGSREGVIGLTQGERTATISTIVGDYVPVGKLLETEPPNHLQVDGDALRAALKQASVASTTVDLDMGEVLTVRATDGEKGARLADWETQLDYQPDLAGVEDRKVIRADYLASCIEAVEGPEVQVGYFPAGTRQIVTLNRGHAKQAALMAIRRD